MGKTPAQRKSLTSVRSSPLAGDKLMEVDGDADMTPDNLVELKDEILNNLRSDKAADRECGALLFANLLDSNKRGLESWVSRDDEGAAKKTHLGDMARTLAPLLLDEKPSVRAAVAEALSHLASSCDTLAELMVELDIMTPVRALFEKFYDNDTWMDTKEGKNKFEKATFEFACQNIASLCSKSTKALRVYNSSNVTKILIKNLLAHSKCIRSSIAAAEALVTVSEDNIIVDLRQKDFISFLISLLTSTPSTPPEILLTNHVGSLLISVSDIMNEAETKTATNLVLNNLSRTLSVPCQDKLVQLADVISKLGDVEFKNDAGSEALVDASAELVDILSAKRVSIETLANICSENDGENDIDDDEEISASRESLASSNESVGSGLTEAKGLDPDFEGAIKNLGLFTQVVNHLDAPTDAMKSELRKVYVGREVLDSIRDVQRTSLLCVNNMVQCLPKDDLQDTGLLTQRLLAIIRMAAPEKNPLLAEAVSVVRALVGNELLDIPASDFEMFFNLINTSHDDLLRTNAIKILGCVGSRSTQLADIQTLTVFLLELVEKDDKAIGVDVKAEALDNIVDVFAEDNKTDEIANKTNLLHRLREAGKKFKAQVKAENKKNPVADTVSLNLNRFVKYKQGMLSKH